jgi:hypothetical protein
VHIRIRIKLSFRKLVHRDNETTRATLPGSDLPPKMDVPFAEQTAYDPLCCITSTPKKRLEPPKDFSAHDSLLRMKQTNIITLFDFVTTVPGKFKMRSSHVTINFSRLWVSCRMDCISVSEFLASFI